jgi:hypothetical protein
MGNSIPIKEDKTFLCKSPQQKIEDPFEQQ